MPCSQTLRAPNGAVLGAIMTVLVAVPAMAQGDRDQDESNSRGVRIIDAPTLPPNTNAPSPVLKSPGAETTSPALLTPAAPPAAAAVPTLTPPAAGPVLTPAQPVVGETRPAPVLRPPAPELRPIVEAPMPPPARPNSGLGSGASTPAAPALTSPSLAPVLTPAQPVVGETHPAPALLSPAPELRPIVEAPVPPPGRPNSVLGSAASTPAAPGLTPPSLAPSLQPLSRPGSNKGSQPTPSVSNNFANLPKHPTQEDVEGLSIGLKIPNPAGVSMQILPGPDIVVGSQVSFQISSKKAGYLILVDVDATGRLAQIFPNPMSLMAPGGVRENLNLLRPGKPLRIPDRENLYSGFEFIASPPSGTAMVVAILSDRPVQRVDLPDVPISLAGSASAVDYLTKLANELRIPGANGNGRLEEAHWSFDAKFYAIR
jgi:hypothetical protein